MKEILQLLRIATMSSNLIRQQQKSGSGCLPVLGGLSFGAIAMFAIAALVMPREARETEPTPAVAEKPAPPKHKAPIASSYTEAEETAQDLSVGEPPDTNRVAAEPAPIDTSTSAVPDAGAEAQATQTITPEPATPAAAPAATPAAPAEPTHSSSSDGVHVSGYFRKDGTYVRPHYRRHK